MSKSMRDAESDFFLPFGDSGKETWLSQPVWTAFFYILGYLSMDSFEQADSVINSLKRDTLA